MKVDWTAVGSIGTAVTVVVGLVTLYVQRKGPAATARQEVYKRALDALDDFDQRAGKLDYRLLSPEQIIELRLRDPLDVIKGCISDSSTPLARDGELYRLIMHLRLDADQISSTFALSDAQSLLHSFPRNLEDERDVHRLYKELVGLISNGVRQEFVRRDMEKRAGAVREILTAYRRQTIRPRVRRLIVALAPSFIYLLAIIAIAIVAL